MYNEISKQDFWPLICGVDSMLWKGWILSSDFTQWHPYVLPPRLSFINFGIRVGEISCVGTYYRHLLLPFMFSIFFKIWIHSRFCGYRKSAHFSHRTNQNHVSNSVQTIFEFFFNLSLQVVPQICPLDQSWLKTFIYSRNSPSNRHWLALIQF